MFLKKLFDTSKLKKVFETLHTDFENTQKCLYFETPEAVIQVSTNGLM